MAIKHFCDVCDSELERPESGWSRTEFVRLRGGQEVRLTVKAQIVNDSGSHLSWDICSYCVIDAVNKLDDRTQPERKS